MRGAILKRAKGSWTIIIDVGKHPDGRRKQQWITVKGSKRDAERRLAEIVNKVNAGLYIKPSKDTFPSLRPDSETTYPPGSGPLHWTVTGGGPGAS